MTPVARRREIYALCRRHGVLILEDDPYFYLQLRPAAARRAGCAAWASLTCRWMPTAASSAWTAFQRRGAPWPHAWGLQHVWNRAGPDPGAR